MNKYIFLDFDGVLHTNGGNLFSRVELLAKEIQNLDNICIVFSTSWREYRSIENLSNYLPENIRNKCVGKTVVLKDCYKHVRFNEIQIYLKENNIEENQWIALDDMKVLFPPNCKNLIHVDPNTGLQKKHMLMIRKFYDNSFF